VCSIARAAYKTCLFMKTRQRGFALTESLLPDLARSISSSRHNLSLDLSTSPTRQITANQAPRRRDTADIPLGHNERSSIGIPLAQRRNEGGEETDSQDFDRSCFSEVFATHGKSVVEVRRLLDGQPSILQGRQFNVVIIDESDNSIRRHHNPALSLWHGCSPKKRSAFQRHPVAPSQRDP
jgi:hypothetical protein